MKSLLEFIEKTATLCTLGSPYQLIPWLSYFPTSFSRTLKEVINTRDEVFNPELKAHLETYTSGTTRDLTDCFLGTYEKVKAKETCEDIGSIEDIQGLMLDVLSAASETSSSSISWFILYTLLVPDVQQKIYAELDRVVGRDRLPSWQDAKNMPYLQATLCEVLRHSSVVPMIATDAIRDTTISGYHVPKRTPVVLNIYHIHRDERQWPEAGTFKPHRFLDADGNFVGWNTLPSFMPFGLGHRECAGQTLRKIIMFSFASALIHRFKLELAGVDPKPTLEPSGRGAVLRP